MSKGNIFEILEFDLSPDIQIIFDYLESIDVELKVNEVGDPYIFDTRKKEFCYLEMEAISKQFVSDGFLAIYVTFLDFNLDLSISIKTKYQPHPRKLISLKFGISGILEEEIVTIFKELIKKIMNVNKGINALCITLDLRPTDEDIKWEEVIFGRAKIDKSNVPDALVVKQPYTPNLDSSVALRESIKIGGYTFYNFSNKQLEYFLENE